LPWLALNREPPDLRSRIRGMSYWPLTPPPHFHYNTYTYSAQNLYPQTQPYLHLLPKGKDNIEGQIQKLSDHIYP
jgi:hypothetical protein